MNTIHYQMFADYNKWANARLYAAAAALDDSAYRADKGAFFGSLNGTLNHILVADRIWLRRMTGTGDAPNRLNTILHDSLDALTAARVAEDNRIIAFAGGLDDASLAGEFSYTTTKGAPQRQALAPALAHFFNHQTHHRGQAHTLLTMLGQPGPALDLLYYQRKAGKREAGAA